MTELDIIRQLVALVEETRNAQNNYFRQRNDTNLRISKRHEETLDKYVKFLHTHGYPPAERPDPPKQNPLF